MPYKNIPEEGLKNKVARDYFAAYDCTDIVGKVDFCVMPKKIPGQALMFKEQSLLWAEAKAGKRDVVAMFAQLILTIGRARTFDKNLPPAFLGVFDAEKIAFVAYEKVQHLFYTSDFNWNVAPSDHGTKEFAEIRSLIDGVLESGKHLYHFGKDDRELFFFIKNSLAKGAETGRIRIDKNNFVSVYLRWLDEVKPLIGFDFEGGTKRQIVDSDFYLADLFVDDKNTAAIDDDVPVREDLFVVFRGGNYEIAKESIRQLYDAVIKIKSKTAYEHFWKRYKRPPTGEYQDYIIKRRDLLVPQDVRERKGAFFTPKQWVELSQRYIADTLGEDWQEEYYVWDCAAGTGNLLAGLTNKRNIWASTLDQGDVQVMQERIKNGANLLENHVFQFDFLNDDLLDAEEDFFDPRTGKRFVKSKLPKSLQEIIKDSEKRKKLVIYINPPYAEASTARTFAGTGENKTAVATDNWTYGKYRLEIGKAGNELFAQFLIRIYREIPGCVIANFSKLKPLQAPNFSKFRKNFRAGLEKLFLMPANTFDNVKGKFPIGFFVWNTAKDELFSEIEADVYDGDRRGLPSKNIAIHVGERRINQWLAQFKSEKTTDPLGFLTATGNDFQHNNMAFIYYAEQPQSHRNHQIHFSIGHDNLVVCCIYLTVRHCIKPTWLNDRDQFLWPNDSWEKDFGFHNDCLAFALFHSQNRITSKEGPNHWIPFTEDEVGAKERFASAFMSDFIAGKIKKTNGNGDLFNKPKVENGTKCRFSPEAQAVFDAGKELWRYYHSQKQGVNANASLYDIREHFQRRNEKGKMNSKSDDPQYTERMGVLRERLDILAEKIAEKVYEHGFLRA